MIPRSEAVTAFIAAHGWDDAERSLLAGDASNRRYDRLIRSDGSQAVFMDAPPEKGEDVRPFVFVARWLHGIGLSAPEILAQDDAHGFLLIEDLGDALFARHIISHPESENSLYEAAIDVLGAVHSAPPPDLPCYDAARMTPLAALALDWYQRGIDQELNIQARDRFTATFQPMLATLDGEAEVLIQRDYHAENLLWLPERSGPARVGLLDFQDAMLGHRAYDLVSVLQDARRDVPTDMARRMIARYVALNSLNSDEFDRAYALLGVQRNLRILGVFARLCLRDGKAHYVELIPRVWAHLQTDLTHPALEPIASLLQDALPMPTDENLERLRAQCKTILTR